MEYTGVDGVMIGMSRDMVTLLAPLIPSLRRYARSMVRDHAAADDLVQDCLEKAISRWHQRRSEGSARTWVFTILHNLAVTGFRQAARRGTHVPIEEVCESGLATPATQGDRLNQSAVIDALGRLSEDQRSVLLLVAIEELSYAEAAQVLAIPIGTVMSRLSRARQRFAQIVDEPARDGPTRQTMLRSVK